MSARPAVDAVRAVEVPDGTIAVHLAARQTDHAGTIMGTRGARLVVDLVREAVA